LAIARAGRWLALFIGLSRSHRATLDAISGRGVQRGRVGRGVAVERVVGDWRRLRRGPRWPSGAKEGVLSGKSDMQLRQVAGIAGNAGVATPYAREEVEIYLSINIAFYRQWGAGIPAIPSIPANLSGWPNLPHWASTTTANCRRPYPYRLLTITRTRTRTRAPDAGRQSNPLRRSRASPHACAYTPARIGIEHRLMNGL